MKFAVSKGETELSELTARIFDIKGRGAAETARKAEAALLKANPHIADLSLWHLNADQQLMGFSDPADFRALGEVLSDLAR